MKRKHSFYSTIAWATFILNILLETSSVYAQLTSDFDPKKLKDAEFYLSEVLRLYRDKKNWSSASDLTISFEGLMEDIEVNLPDENFRTSNLRPYLALQYFYLGLAKAKVGYAAQALAYFDSCKFIDPNVLDFTVTLENKSATVTDFINSYLRELESKATKVNFRIVTYISLETINPSKIRITQLDPQTKIEAETDIFKSYLIKADSAIWENSDINWDRGKEIAIYFPKGKYKLIAIDSTCDEIIFSVPANKEIELKPYRWFTLKLPSHCTLGQHVKIFRDFGFASEQEINNIEQLRKLAFGIYRFDIKDRNFRNCFPERVEFLMQGVAHPKDPSSIAKLIPVQEKAAYSFPCSQ